jgi:hypothetical protein
MIATHKIGFQDRLPPSYDFNVFLWKLHNRLGHLPGPTYLRRQTRQTLVIHEVDALCLTQIFPFFYYRRIIERRFNLRLTFQSKKDFLARPERSKRNASLVLLQSWFTTPKDLLQGLLLLIKTRNPNAKVVFLDAMSPTDLRLASVLSGKIDLYIKKHLLKDRNLYGTPTRGHTNLTDFYMRQYGISAPETTFKIPPGFLSKIIVGPSFFTAPELLGHFKFSPLADHTRKSIDLHGRMNSEGTDWYTQMRREAKVKLSQLNGMTILSDGEVPPRQYFSELRASKMCLSPFGYGEGCHRDFEAAYGGALLLKPDVSHLETNPDIFIPYKTYVPLDWRLGDLEEKARHYLAHDGERRHIVDNAYRVLHEYCRTDQFLEQMRPVFE